MKIPLVYILLPLFGPLLVAVPAFSQASAVGRMTPLEISAAVTAKPNSGFVFIQDEGFLTPTDCKAQMPSESLFTPLGWVRAQSLLAKQQFKPFQPADEDTEEVLTVISRGCADGRPGGPVCDSITRAVLLADKAGSVVIEAASSKAVAVTWQNTYGATSSCSNLVSRFSMDDLKRVRNEKGEFIVATFSGPTLLKMYKVKQKHVKQLGL